MTKPKTLKDINSISDLGKWALRKEVIKWVKEDIRELRGKGLLVSMNPCAWDLLRKWMRRFNITEEDLK